VTNLNIAHQRLGNQLIAKAAFEKPGEVVGWFGALQAQDYFGALWAVGLRMGKATEAEIDQAMADGIIVRTHPMRGTLHFVAAEDIRWLLKLLAGRSMAGNARWYRRLELDDATLAKSNAVIAKTLRGGKQLTRRELAAALERAGISTEGLRLTFLLNQAELESLIGSGARRGRQFTFALLDEIVPVNRILERDEALAKLARRYFTSHGPATLQDFAWWSGLTVTDARAGLEMVKSQFIREIIDNRTYWFSPFRPGVKINSPTVFLLPVYDEYAVAYKDRSAVLDPQYARPTGNGLSPVIVINGQIKGTWKRVLKKDRVNVSANPFAKLDEAETSALATVAARYGKFLEMPVALA
jgi:hypothetical protein